MGVRNILVEGVSGTGKSSVCRELRRRAYHALDEKWGERVVAVVQPVAGRSVDVAELTASVKEQIGSVKAAKQVEVWVDLPRSKVGKVLKNEIKDRLRPPVE